jgi:hypothetical protein
MTGVVLLLGLLLLLVGLKYLTRKMPPEKVSETWLQERRRMNAL